MLQHLPKQPLQNPTHFSVSTRIPPYPLNLFSLDHECRAVCNLLLSLTHSRSLKQGLQLHAHIIKAGIQLIPLISHHLINFYSKSRFPLHSRQNFEETHFKSVTTWSSVISSFAQNELPLLVFGYFRRMLGLGVLPDDHIFPSATKACATIGAYDVGQSVHCLSLKTGYNFDVFVGSSCHRMDYRSNGTRTNWTSIDSNWEITITTKRTATVLI